MVNTLMSELLHSSARPPRRAAEGRQGQLDAEAVVGAKASEAEAPQAVQMGSETKYYAPVRPPRPDHPVLVVFLTPTHLVTNVIVPSPHSYG